MEKQKPINNELLNKIKEGLVKSGFPLELSIAKIMQNKGWSYTIASQYLDIETNTLRESDIVAEKEINGVKICLIVECKKSDNKQLVLYQPEPKIPFGKSYHQLGSFKIFPKLDSENKRGRLLGAFVRNLQSLPIMSDKHKNSNNIIFTIGDKIEQNNTSFFSSLNGLLKRSVVDANMSELETYKTIYLYLIIYDGYMLRLSQSEGNSDIILEEIDYGVYEMRYNFSLSSAIDIDYYANVKAFGSRYLIEIIKPSYFGYYIDRITDVVNKIDHQSLEGWGTNWPDELPF